MVPQHVRAFEDNRPLADQTDSLVVRALQEALQHLHDPARSQTAGLGAEGPRPTLLADHVNGPQLERLLVLRQLRQKREDERCWCAPHQEFGAIEAHESLDILRKVCGVFEQHIIKVEGSLAPAQRPASIAWKKGPLLWGGEHPVPLICLLGHRHFDALPARQHHGPSCLEAIAIAAKATAQHMSHACTAGGTRTDGSLTA